MGLLYGVSLQIINQLFKRCFLEALINQSFHLLSGYLVKDSIEGLKNGSADKRTNCFCWGRVYDSQHLYGSPQPSLTQISRYLTPSDLCKQQAYQFSTEIYAGKTYIL